MLKKKKKGCGVEEKKTKQHSVVCVIAKLYFQTPKLAYTAQSSNVGVSAPGQNIRVLSDPALLTTCVS